MNNQETAQITLDQLGGKRRLALMIGAHQFSHGKDGLNVRFKAKAKNRANHLTVSLDPSDTYHVKFFSIRGTTCKVVGEFTEIYAENLRPLFEQETGLYLSL